MNDKVLITNVQRFSLHDGPGIGGYTDTERNCQTVIELIKQYQPMKVELLKEHNLGKRKYLTLGKTPLDLHMVTDAEMEKYKNAVIKETGVVAEVCKV